MVSATPTGVAAFAALALAAGYWGGGRSEPTASQSPVQTAQTAPEPSVPETASAVPATPQDQPASSAMDEATFWRLISETRAAAGNETGRQSELLTDRLAQLSPESIVEFARIREGLDKRAYSWDIWGAGYVIEDGCSDDCFRDFRAYVISLGREPYEAAMSNPDSLAGVAKDAEQGNWENADNPAPDAYSSVTGDDFPLDDTDLSGNPSGEPWNENDMAALARRYPRLYARFR